MTTTTYRILDNANEILKSERDQEMRYAFIKMLFDISGSMTRYAKDLYRSAVRVLKIQETSNEGNLDCETRVQLVTFNDDIKEKNQSYMTPGELSDCFTEDDFKCGGGTNLSAAVTYILESFNTKSKPMENLRKGDPKPLLVICTDCVGTDDEVAQQKALEKYKTHELLHAYVNIVVIFVGPESKRDMAVVLAGGKEDHVISIDGDLASLLVPVIQESTVNLSNGTYGTSNNKAENPANIMNNAKKRATHGKTSGETLTAEELRKQLDAVFNNTVFV